MGRKKKYSTDQEKSDAQRKWAREYYTRNKEKINEKLMKKYYELRKNLQSNNREGER